MKQEYKYFYGCCIFCVCFGAILFIASIFKSPLTRSKTAEAKNAIKNLYRLLDHVAFINGFSNTACFLVEQSKTNVASVFLTNVIDTVFKSDSRHPVPHDIKLLDPWQKKLNVAWQSDLNQTIETKNLLAFHLPLVIWSSGENGINEFGGGDDIVLSTNTITTWSELK